MHLLSRVAKSRFSIAITFLILGFFFGHLFYVLRYSPSEDEILRRLVSEYFLRASGAGLTGDVSYGDCNLSRANGSMAESGVVKYYGVCKSSVNGGGVVVMSAGLSEIGTIVFIEEGSI